MEDYIINQNSLRCLRTFYKYDKNENKLKTLLAKPYLDFIERFKDKITNIPTIDDIVDFYLQNKEKIDFSDQYAVYDFLSSIKELEPEDPNFIDIFKTCTDLNKKISQENVTRIKALQREYFIRFKHSRNEEWSDNELFDYKLKLWVNTKIENVQELAIELAKFLDLQDKEKDECGTSFKISANLRRNDTVTIYTNYKLAEGVINFLTDLREKKPHLFTTESKPNPFVMKINDFISYADIGHNKSFPMEISNIYRYVEHHKSANFEDMCEKQRKIEVKSIILEHMIYQLQNSKDDDALINPKNMASCRTPDGYSNRKITEEDRELYIKKLQEMKNNVDKQSESSQTTNEEENELE